MKMEAVTSHREAWLWDGHGRSASADLVNGEPASPPPSPSLPELRNHQGPRVRVTGGGSTSGRPLPPLPPAHLALLVGFGAFADALPWPHLLLPPLLLLLLLPAHGGHLLVKVQLARKALGAGGQPGHVSKREPAVAWMCCPRSSSSARAGAACPAALSGQPCPSRALPCPALPPRPPLPLTACLTARSTRSARRRPHASPPAPALRAACVGA